MHQSTRMLSFAMQGDSGMEGLRSGRLWHETAEALQTLPMVDKTATAHVQPVWHSLESTSAALQSWSRLRPGLTCSLTRRCDRSKHTLCHA